MSSSKRLFLIDGNAIAYRSYYAFIQRPLVTAKGQPTSAVYGFVTFLNRILTQESPDYIAVVFDTGAPTFRHKAYKEYKATRQRMPEDLVSQLAIIKDVVRAYRIPVLEMDGFEADDIIGTLARHAEREGALAFLVSADKDFMQLVSNKIKMYKPGRQGTDVDIIDISSVKEKFGVPPDKVIEVLGLIGDSSDNVPGVPGVGEKTAIPLIQQYGSIDNLYKNISKIEQKGLRLKLETNKDLAFLSRELVTIDTKVPLNVHFDTLKVEEKDAEKLTELFRELEFRALLQGLQRTTPAKPAPPEDMDFPLPDEELSDIRSDKHTYTLVADLKALKSLCTQLKKSKQFVFDTETTSVDSLNAELVGISFCMRPREAFFVAVKPGSATELGDLFEKSSAAEKTNGLNLDDVLTHLKPILEDRRMDKIGHNIKYDMLVLSQYGVWAQGIAVDTMIASYILRADGRHGLDALAKEHLQYKTVSFTELTGSGKEQKPIRDVPLQSLSDYSCEDADITLRLYEALHEKLSAQKMLKLCEDLEFPLVAVLARMERAGIGIDVEYLKKMSKDLEQVLGLLVKEIHAFAGYEFNINSTQQLGEVLFVKLKLPTFKKTKTGFSTDVGVLESLQHEHPIIEKLLEYRQLAKLKSTYVDALPALINHRTGRVHTSFNQTVASTGRLSSSDPNLQNIPIRTELGKSIRKAFVPANKSDLILSADYSQIELRVMAHISRDEALSEAFRNNEDIHMTTAAKVFGVDVSEITKDMRRKAKEVNFGIMYGIGPFGLANRLEISQGEAKDIIARYFERFPKVKQYITDTISSVRSKGYVETLLGRRRYLPDINSGNQNIRQNAERQAINMPIQGTAADMLKLAMIEIDHAFTKQALQSQMLLQVHDELVFEVKKKEEKEVRTIVEKLMRNAMKLNVPIVVEIGVGKNWLEAH
ncbi:MAG: DNA polymerase I [Ignavibacteriales bacterium]|nr:DNA polymerase I [Ignavibacteriales bacterium]